MEAGTVVRITNIMHVHDVHMYPWQARLTCVYGCLLIPWFPALHNMLRSMAPQILAAASKDGTISLSDARMGASFAHLEHSRQPCHVAGAASVPNGMLCMFVSKRLGKPQSWHSAAYDMRCLGKHIRPVLWEHCNEAKYDSQSRHVPRASVCIPLDGPQVALILNDPRYVDLVQTFTGKHAPSKQRQRINRVLQITSLHNQRATEYLLCAAHGGLVVANRLFPHNLSFIRFKSDDSLCDNV